MLPFWAIFDCLNLQNLIVLWLVGLGIGYSKSTTLGFRYATAIINLIVVVVFFHGTCRGVFNSLLRVKSSKSNFFSSVSAYFETVKTNGWGILYFQYLLWLKNVSCFSDLCKKIAGEDRFLTRLLSFFDQVIRWKLILEDINQVLFEIGHLALATNDTFVFACQLNNDANLVISQVQMHSWTHNATCLKYGRNKTQYPFNFSCFIIPNLHIDDTGSIFLQKNNVWINLWNSALDFILQSNHKVTFVALSNNALAFIHYIINYAIKGNCS